MVAVTDGLQAGLYNNRNIFLLLLLSARLGNGKISSNVLF